MHGSEQYFFPQALEKTCIPQRRSRDAGRHSTGGKAAVLLKYCVMEARRQCSSTKGLYFLPLSWWKAGSRGAVLFHEVLVYYNMMLLPYTIYWLRPQALESEKPESEFWLSSIVLRTCTSCHL